VIVHCRVSARPPGVGGAGLRRPGAPGQVGELGGPEHGAQAVERLLFLGEVRPQLEEECAGPLDEAEAGGVERDHLVEQRVDLLVLAQAGGHLRARGGHVRLQGGEDHLLLAGFVGGQLADDPEVDRVQLDRVLLGVQPVEQRFEPPVIRGEQIDHVL
jgi:hypothetical protein